MTESAAVYRTKRSQSPLHFTASGTPRPKQSFKLGNGHGYQPKRVTDWQVLVRTEAAAAMQGREPFSGDLFVTLDFYLPDRRRRDLDNLSKGTLDACNKVVWLDDQQITSLLVNKFYGRRECGVTVAVELAAELDRRDQPGGAE